MPTESFSGGSGELTFSYGWLKNHQRQSTAVNNNSFQYSPAAGTTNYAAADVDNGYTTVAGVNLTYDGNHNLAYDGFNTLTYDVENRLIQAQNGVPGTSTYLYDPLGHRKQKQVGTVTTQFVLAGSDEIADYAGTGAGTPLSLTVRGVGGLPVAAIATSTGAVVYYHHDALGSTVAVTQAGTSGPGDVYTYGEFGGQGAGSWATYRFAGYRYDTETGLYYVRARYYSPILGRFLQTDPIGYAGGANLFAYAGNDPVNSTDQNGTCNSNCPSNLEGSGSGSSLLSSAGNFLSSVGNFVVNNPGTTMAVLGTVATAFVLGPETLAAIPEEVTAAGVVAGTAAAAEDQAVQIFRAVDQDELQYIPSEGTYGSSPSMYGKYFALAQEGAQNFANSTINAGQQMTITSTTIPTSILNQGFFFNDVGGAGASVHFQQEFLPTLYNLMTPINLH
jgi:RHS repeat-associated protein